MAEQNIQKLLKEQTERLEKSFGKRTDEILGESRRHQKMLLEEFQSRLKVVAEVQVEHTKKFDSLFEMVAMNTETLEIIKGMLKRKVDIDEYEKLEKRVFILEKKLRVSGS